MIILSIKTDKPQAEIALYNGKTQIAHHARQAHKKLSDTIHIEIMELLKAQHLELSDLRGIAVFAGPGSFTGLRIGAAVANSLAYALDIRVASADGDNWLNEAILSLESGQSIGPAIPIYGSEAKTTVQKK